MTSRPILRNFAIVALSGIATSIFYCLFSNDWIFGLFSYLGISSLVIILLLGVLKRKRASNRAYFTVAILGILAGLLFGIAYRLDPTEGFNYAFGTKQIPAGVSEIAVRKQYVGGPGDRMVMMEFLANQEAIKTLTSSRNFTKDVETIEVAYDAKRDWTTILKRVFGDVPKFPKTEIIAEMKSPEIYRWQQAPVENTTLLWDAASSKAYVVYSKG